MANANAQINPQKRVLCKGFWYHFSLNSLECWAIGWCSLGWFIMLLNFNCSEVSLFCILYARDKAVLQSFKSAALLYRLFWFIGICILCLSPIKVQGSQAIAIDSAQAQYILNTSKLAKSLAFKSFQQKQAASLLLYQPDGQTLYDKSSALPLIPASITKILTAQMALEYWGKDYQFFTDFWIEVLPAVQNESRHGANLWVKGYGDPFLTSEELAQIGRTLAMKFADLGVDYINKIVIDNHYYQSLIKMPGAGKSDNPYDAIPTALAANFNTVYVQRNNDKWVSAEMQTPITDVAIQVANKRFLPAGKNRGTISSVVKNGFKARINLGINPKINEMHFVQLLQSFMQQAAQSAGYSLQTQPVNIVWQDSKMIAESANLNPLIDSIRHYNRKTLQAVLQPMLKYSTNFIANQLALNMAADYYQRPADEHLVEAYYKLWGQKWFPKAVFKEGAGLSRQNQVSAEQMSLLLKRFFGNKNLLPEVMPGVFAKSGTLKGVSTLAGFIHKGNHWLPFVLMVNEPVSYGYRNRLISDIRNALHQRLD